MFNSIITYLFILFLIIQNSFGQQENFSVQIIPDSLKNNANTIIRKSNVIVNISAFNKMTVKQEKIISVLTPKGDENALFIVYYDPNTKIKDIKINIYDKNGKLIKKVRKDEIKDYGADGSNLYTDNRVLIYKFLPISYPYTIYYTYTSKTSNTAFIPSFSPVENYDLAIEQSNYKLIFPSGTKIFTKENNLNKYPNFTKRKLTHQIQYIFNNQVAVKNEAYSPPTSIIFPSVKFSMNKFSLTGVTAQVENWNDFGKWYQDNLLKNRDLLTSKTENDIINLTKNIDDINDKIKKVYEYMQEKTRYVSVQIGIGGWQPISAMEVDKKKYGDCKALVNYTKALLKVANINSYFTIIYGGAKKNIDADLIGIQGNHAILTVPTKKDTLWLECTSKKDPAGYLGTFTSDRKAILINGFQTKIIKTKKYSLKENLIIRSSKISLKENGTSEIILQIKSKGIMYEDNFHLQYSDSSNVIKYYKNSFSKLINPKILNYTFNNDKKNAVFEENIKIKSSDVLKKLSEKEYYFSQNILNTSEYNIPRYSNRKYPLYIENSFSTIDSITFSIPKNFKIKFLPEDYKKEEKFGSISYKYLNEFNQIIIIKKLVIKEGMYSKKEYEKFYKFFKKFKKKDKKNIIISKL